MLDTPVSGAQNYFTPETKFVDEGWQGKSFLAERLAAAPYLRGSVARSIFLGLGEEKNSVGGKAEKKLPYVEPSARTKALAARMRAEFQAANDDGRIDFYDLVEGKIGGQAILAADLAELDAEEAAKPSRKVTPRHTAEFVSPTDKLLSRETRTHEHVASFLPPEWRKFLEKLSDTRRVEREKLIIELVGWDGLEVLGLRPEKLREMAANEAAAYALEWPHKDKDGNLINQHPDQRRRRDEKWHLRKLAKLQRKTILRVEGALKAVGGRNAWARPTYVSDYLLGLYREHVDLTEEILQGLRLVKVDDPTVQISMTELNEKAKRQAAAKRSLMIDMMLKRWQALGWRVCWITVTLPGEYVCHATNEETRTSQHDPRMFGPWEALDKIQDDMKVVLQILRNKKIRPSGMWCGQPQQSGSPHRHILLAVPTLEEARGVCDEFRKKFSTRLEADGRGQDRGCDARVIGDTDKRYAAKPQPDGRETTPMSAARYAARYSTRQEQKVDLKRVEKFEEWSKEIGDRKLFGEELKEFQREQKAVKEILDSERYRAWKWIRRTRTHTWIGLDSGRAPNEMWDVLWKCAQRGDREPEDARMALAMRHMIKVREFSKLAEGVRSAMQAMDKEDEALAEMEETLRQHSDAAATEAWHAAIAMGMWPDSDLDPVEVKWLREAVAEWEMTGVEIDEVAESATIISLITRRAADPLPPMPLRETGENSYGETVSKTVGVVGAVTRFTFKNDMPQEAEIQEAAEVLGLSKALKFASDTLVEKRNGRELTVWRFRKVFFGLAETAGFAFSKRPSGRLVIFDQSGETMIKTPDAWKIVDEDTAAKMVEDFNSGFESDSSTAHNSDDVFVFNDSSPDNRHLSKAVGADAPPVGYVSPPGEIPF
ncbi:replication endonuclease [Brucella intermedia]|uniref:replication endonuclease n=1 Tax=Brucella intermedia TaxID=94625 RepID=UPI00244EA7A0|nr:replication endonuclease [Brucella intermedia]WGJ06624.1 replication endonuclease [Brucella intermedia]